MASLAAFTIFDLKNQFLRSNCFFGLFGIFLFFWSSNLHAEDPERPNIIWIIAEDMSPDLGCYGNQVVTTPNIDALAVKGMQFTHVFTTSPACSPSRTALATGVFQTTLGAHHMRYSKELMPTLPPLVKTLPQLMGERGYYTGNIKGLGGTGKDDWQFKTSKKSWGTHSWQKLVKNQPFFAQINSRESHRGFYPAKNIPKEKIVIPPYYPDHPVSRSDWAGYFESINRFDKQVGAIMKQLQDDNLEKNTIICILSDHGRPMIRGKNWLYDSGTHIPLIIFYPKGLKHPFGYKSGTKNSSIISAIDLVAETILMTGGNTPAWMQGRSFLQENSKPREFVYSAVDRFGDVDICSRVIRSNRYKYIRNFKTAGSINGYTTAYRRSTHPIYHLLNIMGEKNLLTPVQAKLLMPLESEELYDIENDPYETINLIGKTSFVKVHQQLRRQLESWLVISEDKGLQSDNDAIIEHFKQYGIKTFEKRSESIKAMKASVEKYFD